MRERSDPWPTLVAVGILCGLAIGAVFVLLFRRDRDPLGLPPGLPDLDADLDPLPAPRSKRYDKLLPVKSRPVARTVTVGNGDPVLLLKAVGRRDWTVWVRVVGPPGSFASFSISNNAGDAISVPAGGFHQMRIPCGEFLYAQGDMPSVMVSASGGEG
jgi:hypothetical protein